ncbi:glutathione S-transferase family protein [Parvularcula lutaonensis]|uniref:Glutathione S-transferase family protein n=1 Tax=Parvularcula lutaonensis TaxID=491923 RepID=A0ABV7MC41_9PROT|nr:glutathione S-transferase family protein [Parvularcula lutaonensis]
MLEFFTNPMSRGQIVRWMLEEVGAPYEERIIQYGPEMKGPEYTAINPMGKVPAIRHDGKVVTEVAAICAYLADAFPEKGLGPTPEDRHDYYRWMFFAAGPVEQAVSMNSAGIVPTEEQSRSFGFGSYDKVVDVLETLLSDRDYVCGARFSAADVYLGSQIVWGLQFETLPKRDAFAAYAGRLTGRDPFRKAKARDMALIAEMEAAKAQ